MINMVYTLIVAFSLLNPILVTAQATTLDSHQHVKDFGTINLQDLEPADYKVFVDSVNSISNDGTYLKVSDGLNFRINWWYQSSVKQWKNGDQLYITWDGNYQQFRIDNITCNETAWSREGPSLSNSPLEIQYIKKEYLGDSIIVLNNDHVFKVQDPLFKWREGDRVVILAGSENTCQLWNLDINFVIPFEYLGVIPQPVLNKPEEPEVVCDCNADETNENETPEINQVNDNLTDDSL